MLDFQWFYGGAGQGVGWVVLYYRMFLAKVQVCVKHA
jgi:hypothetical protein